MAELQQVLVAGGPVFLTFCVSMLCWDEDVLIFVPGEISP